MTLRHKTFSAVRWTTTAAVIRAILQIAQVAVLARLLSPEDYGLVAVVLGFAGMFADLGVNSAFVQRQVVTQEQRSSLFWLNVAMSAGLSLLVIALSPMFAWFFNDVRLTPLMMLSASTFVIGALGLQVRMAAEKELDFRPVVLLEVTAAIFGFISALFAAFAGWGVYALVLGSIVAAVTSTAFAWLFIARGWRPMWRLRMGDVRPYLGFGGAMVANNIVNQINMSIDIFLGARLLGAAQLGLYSVPRNLVLQLQMMVNPIITRVGFPLIAQVQHDVVRVRSIYLKTLNMTASTNAPLYVGIAFLRRKLWRSCWGMGGRRQPHCCAFWSPGDYFDPSATPQVACYLEWASRFGPEMEYRIVVHRPSHNLVGISIRCCGFGLVTFGFDDWFIYSRLVRSHSPALSGWFD